MNDDTKLSKESQDHEQTVSGRVEPVVSWIRPSELLLGYLEFKEITKSRELDVDTKRWLAEWNSWDLACSPMDDKERSFIRYGHHLGFFRGISN